MNLVKATRSITEDSAAGSNTAYSLRGPNILQNMSIGGPPIGGPSSGSPRNSGMALGSRFLPGISATSAPVPLPAAPLSTNDHGSLILARQRQLQAMSNMNNLNIQSFNRNTFNTYPFSTLSALQNRSSTMSAFLASAQTARHEAALLEAATHARQEAALLEAAVGFGSRHMGASASSSARAVAARRASPNMMVSNMQPISSSTAARPSFSSMLAHRQLDSLGGAAGRMALDESLIAHQHLQQQQQAIRDLGALRNQMQQSNAFSFQRQQNEERAAKRNIQQQGSKRQKFL